MFNPNVGLQVEREDSREETDARGGTIPRMKKTNRKCLENILGEGFPAFLGHLFHPNEQSLPLPLLLPATLLAQLGSDCDIRIFPSPPESTSSSLIGSSEPL